MHGQPFTGGPFQPMLLLGSGQSGDGFVVPEGKNVPTSGRFNVLRNPAEVLQSLDSIGAKAPSLSALTRLPYLCSP